MMLLVNGLLDHEMQGDMELMIILAVAAHNVEMLVVLFCALVLSSLIRSLLDINDVVLGCLWLLNDRFLMLLSKLAAFLKVGRVVRMAIWVVEGFMHSLLVVRDGLDIFLMVKVVIELRVRIVYEEEGVVVNFFMVLNDRRMGLLLGVADTFLGWVVDLVALLGLVALIVSSVRVDVEGQAVQCLVL